MCTTGAVLGSHGDIPVGREHRGWEGGSSNGGQVGGAQGARSVVPHLPNSDALLSPTWGTHLIITMIKLPYLAMPPRVWQANEACSPYTHRLRIAPRIIPNTFPPRKYRPRPSCPSPPAPHAVPRRGRPRLRGVISAPSAICAIPARAFAAPPVRPPARLPPRPLVLAVPHSEHAISPSPPSFPFEFFVNMYYYILQIEWFHLYSCCARGSTGKLLSRDTMVAGDI